MKKTTTIFIIVVRLSGEYFKCVLLKKFPAEVHLFGGVSVFPSRCVVALVEAWPRPLHRESKDTLIGTRLTLCDLYE